MKNFIFILLLLLFPYFGVYGESLFFSQKEIELIEKIDKEISEKEQKRKATQRKVREDREKKRLEQERKRKAREKLERERKKQTAIKKKISKVHRDYRLNLVLKHEDSWSVYINDLVFTDKESEIDYIKVLDIKEDTVSLRIKIKDLGDMIHNLEDMIKAKEGNKLIISHGDGSIYLEEIGEGDFFIFFDLHPGEIFDLIKLEVQKGGDNAKGSGNTKSE